MKRFIGIVLLFVFVSSFSMADMVDLTFLNKDRFRFSISVPFDVSKEIGLRRFLESAYNIQQTRVFDEYYLGDILWMSWTPSGDELWFGVLGDSLLYKAGDSVSLHKFRSLSSHQNGYSLGFKAEFRFWKNFWLGLGYFQTPRFYIDTAEELDEMIFEEIELLYKDPIWWFIDWRMYYEYYAKLDRKTTRMTTKEKFWFDDYYVLVTGEFGPDFLKLKAGAGINFLKINYRFEKRIKYNWLKPFLAEEISQVIDNTQKGTENDWCIRPYLLAGIRVPVIHGFSIEAEGLLMGHSEDYQYSTNFLFPVQENWKVKIGEAGIFIVCSWSF